MTLYSNSNNFLHLRKILFSLLFIFLGSCQLDQSLNNIKNTLFESEDDLEKVNDGNEVSSENEKSSSVAKKSYKNSSNKSDKLFTPQKVDDDKRILDFFTSFFSQGDDSENVNLDELNKEKKEDYRSVNKKLNNKIISEKRNTSEETKIQTKKQEVIANETVEQERVVLKKPQEISPPTELDKDQVIIRKPIPQEGLESNFKKETELEKVSDSNLEDESFAFFDIQKTKKIKKKNPDNSKIIMLDCCFH